MERRRLRFLAALIVYVVWVASLGGLAALSGRKPPPRPAIPNQAGRTSDAWPDAARATRAAAIDGTMGAPIRHARTAETVLNVLIAYLLIELA